MFVNHRLDLDKMNYDCIMIINYCISFDRMNIQKIHEMHIPNNKDPY
jgi:hypothetical protein